MPDTSPHRERLLELCGELFRDRRLLIASNRGPLEFYYEYENGRLAARRGSGGVVTALAAVTEYVPAFWVAAALSDADREAARAGLITWPDRPGALRLLTPTRRAYRLYYDRVANPLLWFLQHYMWFSPYTPNIGPVLHRAWREGYRAVNRLFAEALAELAAESREPPIVMFHDYHLYLAPGWFRARFRRAILHHFIHIPWPEPAYWALLPAEFRAEICASLLANDIVGFHTIQSARNFLATCQAFLPEAEVDFRAGTVWYNEHLTWVRCYPISIDVQNLRRLAASEEVERYIAELEPVFGPQTIVRVDRLELSKNILRGFQAFELLLRRRPDLHGRVKFVAFLVPSRTGIRAYQEYAGKIFRFAERLNRRYGRNGWQPVHIFYENNYPRAIAGMARADVLLVNPVADGMNLVAKEGPIVSRRNLVLILSESAGAYDQLKSACLSVAAADIEGTARALEEALAMPPDERADRVARLRAIIEDQDLTWWLVRQLEDLQKLA